MDKIAVLIPCYNEAVTISKVVRDFRRELPEATIYVYDNNSTDETAALARESGAVVRHEYRQGKGNVIRRMFREIEAESYVLVDGDDTYPAESALDMVTLIQEGKAEMVIGDRLSTTYQTENKRAFHNFGNNLVRNAINTIFHTEVQDIMTGYRAFSYLFVKSFPMLSRGFEIETEMTIHAIDKNMRIMSVRIPYRDRPEGSESKLNTFSDGARVIHQIIRLTSNYKPFIFFGTISLLLAVISVVFFIPVFWEWIHTGLVPNFPTLITCGFTMIAAIHAFFVGWSANIGIQRERREFELHLIEVEHWKSNK